MSDTHGHFRAARKAVKRFDKLKAGHIIHCGDVGGIEVFDELAGRPFTFVWGNTDSPSDGVLAYVQSLGVPLPTDVPVTVELGGKKFAVFHGHELEFQNCKKLKCDYVLYGHTHEADIEVLDGKCFVNPGALFRAYPKTVATINTDTSEIQFHEIEVK
jgi:putative phosphoesterase